MDALAMAADAALVEARASLGDHFGLCRASIRLRTPDDPDQLEVVALWTPSGSVVGVGVRMPIRSTALDEIRRTGRPVLRGSVRPGEGLLDEIVHDEGVRSYVSLPLYQAGQPYGLFSLSSSRTAAFGPADLPLLLDVAAVVGSRLSPG